MVGYQFLVEDMLTDPRDLRTGGPTQDVSLYLRT